MHLDVNRSGQDSFRYIFATKYNGRSEEAGQKIPSIMHGFGVVDWAFVSFDVLAIAFANISRTSAGILVILTMSA